MSQLHDPTGAWPVHNIKHMVIKDMPDTDPSIFSKGNHWLMLALSSSATKRLSGCLWVHSAISDISRRICSLIPFNLGIIVQFVYQGFITMDHGWLTIRLTSQHQQLIECLVGMWAILFVTGVPKMAHLQNYSAINCFLGVEPHGFCGYPDTGYPILGDSRCLWHSHRFF